MVSGECLTKNNHIEKQDKEEIKYMMDTLRERFQMLENIFQDREQNAEHLKEVFVEYNFIVK